MMVEKEVVGNLIVVWLCGGTTADITPAQPLKFNMNDACEKIKKSMQNPCEVADGLDV